MSRTGELRLRGLVTAGILAAAALLAPARALASSHNEAPFTSRNPSLDDTDFYMFRDPNDTAMVNLIACRYGLIEPQGGPNYAGFQDGAWYDIKIDNNGDGIEDVDPDRSLGRKHPLLGSLCSPRGTRFRASHPRQPSHLHEGRSRRDPQHSAQGVEG